MVKIIAKSNFVPKGEGEVAILSAKHWDRRSS